LSPFPGPSALAPFKVRSFRLQWPADLLTACAFEMETLILGWYVLVETGSVLLLTVFGSLLFVGTLVAPVFGVVGDRIGHRNLLCGMRAAYACLASTLMVVAFSGALSPVIVCIIAAMTGMIRPSDLGTRTALVADNIPPDQLVPAMGISRTTSDCARVAGAIAGAGMFAAFGIGPAYVAVVSFYVLGLLFTFHCEHARQSERREHGRGGAASLGLA
jgi:MFS family permease